MPFKPCRICKAKVSVNAKTCPQCGAPNPVKAPWNPLRGTVPKAILGVVLIGWMFYYVFTETSPIKRVAVGPHETSYQDDSPPKAPNAMDNGETQLQAKALWVVQTLKSAKKAQLCGLRGHMWATRIIDSIMAGAAKDQQKFRRESGNTREFDAYAKNLEEWEMQHGQPKPPTEYECASMARGPEIDLLIKIEADLKDAQH